MAALNELIQKVENPELRAQLQAAADKLTNQKKFGLVFEEHLPECTPLYDIPVRKGAKVSVRNGKANETFTVLKIEDGVATCLPRNSKEAVQFSVTDLVTTAELGDPIYPCLQKLDEVCNAPDSGLWYTLMTIRIHGGSLLWHTFWSVKNTSAIRSTSDPTESPSSKRKRYKMILLSGWLYKAPTNRLSARKHTGSYRRFARADAEGLHSGIWVCWQGLCTAVTAEQRCIRCGHKAGHTIRNTSPAPHTERKPETAHPIKYGML